MSLRWQIALALSLIAAFLGTAAGVGAYLSTAHELSRSVDQSLAQVVARSNDAASSGQRSRGDEPDRGSADGERCPDAADLAPATEASLIDAEGDVTVCLTVLSSGLAPPEDLEDGYRTVRVGDVRFRVLLGEIDGGHIQVGRSLAEDQDVLDGLRLRLLALVLGGVTVAAIAGLLVTRRITRPIERLRGAAEAIAGSGDLDTPIPVAGSGEVGSLGRSFEAMVAALATSRDQQRRLVDDASHEMRTPLTSLTTNLEHLDHVGEIPADERQEVLAAVRSDVAELTNLLAELVELATDRVDEGAPEVFPLAAVAREVAGRTARRAGREIEVAIGHVALVNARPHLVERAISNLLDNAVKYSPQGEITLRVDGGRVEVADRGPGIGAEDQAHVFDRFYRAVEARTVTGSGLGLSIVQQIVRAHGGTSWATNRDDGPGAAVGFELPIFSS